MTLEKEIAIIKQVIWSFLLLVWGGRYLEHLLLHQLHQAPFVSVEADNFFWLWHATGLVEWSMQHWYAGLVVDLLWLGIAILGWMGRANQWLTGLFVLVFTHYFVCYNSVATHHEHTLVALLFMQGLLLVKQPKRFVLSFVGLRYYAIFVFFSAACWKIARGSAWMSGQLSAFLQSQHITYLTAHPSSTYSEFIYFLINHSFWSDMLWYGGWCIELIFVVGFFTRQYDRLLGVLIIVFFAFDYLIMDICFAEFCIIALLFYPFSRIWGYYESLRPTG